MPFLIILYFPINHLMVAISLENTSYYPDFRYEENKLLSVIGFFKVISKLYLICISTHLI